MTEQKEAKADAEIISSLQVAMGPLLQELKSNRAQQEASFQAFKLETLQLLNEQAGRLFALEQRLAESSGGGCTAQRGSLPKGSSANAMPTPVGVENANVVEVGEVEIFTLSAPNDKTKPGGCPSCFIAVQHLRRKGIKYKEYVFCQGKSAKPKLPRN